MLSLPSPKTNGNFAKKQMQKLKSRICDPHVIFGNHSKEWNANQPPLLSIKTVSVGICARIIRPTVRLSKRGFVSISQLLLGCQIKYRRARQRIGNCANIYFRRISSHQSSVRVACPQFRPRLNGKYFLFEWKSRKRRFSTERI